jgi:hypothetical protein
VAQARCAADAGRPLRLASRTRADPRADVAHDTVQVGWRRHAVAEPGAFWFGVGASSADIRASETVMLTGEVAEYLQRETMATTGTVA